MFYLLIVYVSVMSFTIFKWYLLKMFKHVIFQINQEIDLNVLNFNQIRLLRKWLYLIKNRFGSLFNNYYYFIIINIDVIGLIITFYSVVAFGFKTRMLLMLMYSINMLIFKLISAWFISEIPDQVEKNILIK